LTNNAINASLYPNLSFNFNRDTLAVAGLARRSQGIFGQGGSVIRPLPLESKRHLFLLAYPMPASGVAPQQWSDHLSRLRNSGGNVVQVLTAGFVRPVLLAMSVKVSG
jgi:hypothetical protein